MALSLRQQEILIDIRLLNFERKLTIQVLELKISSPTYMKPYQQEEDIKFFKDHIAVLQENINRSESFLNFNKNA